MLSINSNCPLCDSTNTHIFLKLKNKNIFRCRDCGADHVNPIPTSEEIDKIYRSGEYETRAYFKDDTILPDFIKASETIFAYKSEGTWLDLGSGKGEMAKLAKNQGFQVTGVEVIKSFCDELTTRYGIDMKCGFFDEVDLPKSYFDVICGIDFIEHLSSPAKFLKKIKRLLKPDGVLYLSTVDIDNIVNFTGAALFKTSFGIISSPAERLYPLEHMTFFTRRSLVNLLRLHNFEPLVLRGRSYPIERIKLGLIEKMFFKFAYLIHKLINKNMNIDILVCFADQLKNMSKKISVKKHAVDSNVDRKHFDSLIEKKGRVWWGTSTRAGMRRFEIRSKIVSELLEKYNDPKVFEIGCGAGAWTKTLLQLNPSLKLLACDLSEKGIEVAKKECVEYKNAKFECRDLQSFASVSNSFDAIIGNAILHHIDYDSFLAQAFKMLVPGGFAIFFEPNMLNPLVTMQKKIPIIKKAMGDTPYETAFFRWELASSLKKCGFIEAKAVPFDFIHPLLPSFTLSIVESLGKFLEKIPIIKEFTGSILIYGKKPL